jgi:hypothetical protein
MDNRIFLDEYKIFDETKRSKFFYQSNIANIALVLMCHFRGCYDKYHSQFRLRFPAEQIHQQFISKVGILLDKLITAYSTFSYNDVIGLYYEYMTFYKESINEFLPGDPSDHYNVIKYIRETDDYYVYLSCNLVAEYKCARFFATKIVFHILEQITLTMGLLHLV